MFTAFQNHIADHYPNIGSGKVLLACSGGIDSVVLADLFRRCNLDFAIAHCNFKLRGEASDDDAVFVKQLAERLEVPFYLKGFDTEARKKEQGGSVQMVARDLRYSWFRSLMSKHKFTVLATAHHADDALETFLINLSRGTGIDGLVGMRDKSDLVRPLLPFSRTAIVAYAQENKLVWREDESNIDTKYLRNKIRHDVVPILKTLHPAFLHNVTATQNYLSQVAALAEIAVSDVRKTLFIAKDELYVITIAKLKRLVPLEGYIYGLFKPFGFYNPNEIIQLTTAMSGKEIRSKTHRLLKDRTTLFLQQLNVSTSDSFHITQEQQQILYPFRMTMTPEKAIKESNAKTIYLDKETLKYPLTLRKWEKGDYFYPYGMQGKKKLSKFFKDEKFDQISKEAQWILVSNSKIVWIVGKRADERFKVTTQTKEILKFTLEK